MKNALCVSALFILGFTLAGCAHLGDAYVPEQVIEGAPDMATVFGDLAANDDLVNSFEAKGKIVLRSEVEADQLLPQATVAFQRPDKLYAKGVHRIGAQAFEIVGNGEDFYIDLRNHEPYYGTEGQRIEGIPFAVSPADVAREMFLPEDWSEIDAGAVHVEAVEQAETATFATFTLGPKRRPYRRVVVSGPPWIVDRTERLDKQGRPVVITYRSDYRIIDGIRFPSTIEAVFPTEAARVRFELRDIKMNAELDEHLFDVARPTNNPGDQPAKTAADGLPAGGNRGRIGP